LHLSIVAEHEAGQTANTIFQVFVMSRWRIAPTLPAFLARVQLIAPLASLGYDNYYAVFKPHSRQLLNSWRFHATPQFTQPDNDLK